MSLLRDNYGYLSNLDPLRSTTFLTVDGGSGSDSNLAKDGSVTPVEFYTTAAGFASFSPIIYIEKVVIMISSNTPATLAHYGTIPGELANGTEFFTERNSVKNNTFFPTIVKKTADFYSCRMTKGDPFVFGDTNNIIQWTYDFKGGSDLGLALYPADMARFGLTINDDLTSLSFHQAYVYIGLQRQPAP